MDASPTSLTPDGKHLVYRGASAETQRDVMVLPLNASAAPTPLLQSPFIEDTAEVSPDGHWIAYESNEAGQRDIFVRPFPAVESGKWQLSTSGGTRPMWSPNSRELFYVATIDGAETLVSVAVTAAGSSFSYGNPAAVFPMTTYVPGATRAFDISADGRRFLMVKQGPRTTPPPSLTVVTHWFDELRARVTAK